MKKETQRSNRYKSVRIQTINDQPSRTQQQFKDQVNVNNIMKRYLKTGQITHLNNKQGKYADISTAQDYFSSMNVIAQSTQAFQQLPSHLRKRFGNDPSQLLEFVHNPDNFDEGVKLGIFNAKLPPPSPAPTPTQLPLNNDDSNDDNPKPSKSKKS